MGKSPEQFNDELFETFDTQRIIEQKHSDLGFQSQEDLETTISGLKRLLGHNDASERVIGKYGLLLEMQRSFVEQKTRQRTRRRRFLMLLVGGGVATGAGYYLWDQQQQSNAEKARQELEKKKNYEAEWTLGLVPTRPSVWGWTMRYESAGKYERFEQIGEMKRFSEGTWLGDERGDMLRDAGFVLRSYERSDKKVVPELQRIITTARVDSGLLINTSDNWILRDGQEPDSEKIDTRAVFFEKKDPVGDKVISIPVEIKKVPDQRALDIKYVRPIPKY